MAIVDALIALAQSSGYIIAAGVTASFLLAGAVYTARIQRTVAGLDSTAKRTESLQTGQASLIEDLQHERTDLREQLARLLARVDELERELATLKITVKEAEGALVQCRETEVALRAEIAHLKAS